MISSRPELLQSSDDRRRLRLPQGGIPVLGGSGTRGSVEFGAVLGTGAFDRILDMAVRSEAWADGKALRTLAAATDLPHARAMRRARTSLAWRGLLWRSLLGLVLVLTGTTGASGRIAAQGIPAPRSAHACHGGGEHAVPKSPAPSAPCCTDHVCHCGCLPVAAPVLALCTHAPESELSRSTEAPPWRLDLRPTALLRPPNPSGI